MAVGPGLKDLISIVRYDTFRRWARGVKRKRQKTKRPPGRPRTAAWVEELVVRLARESGWGYTRILGELRKLGVHSVSHTTVRNILKRHGIEPAPERRDPLWETFLKRHAETLWACDFFTARVLTARGMRPAWVLAFIHVKSRRVIVTRATFRPGGQWTADAAACLAGEVQKRGMPKPTVVVRDNDSKFWGGFDDELAEWGIKAERLPIQAPLCNAHMERWIQSLRRECLDHFIPVGLKHLDHLVSEYLEHYHLERPHQGLGNRLLIGHDPPGDEGEVVCRSRLGGVLAALRTAAGGLKQGRTEYLHTASKRVSNSGMPSSRRNQFCTRRGFELQNAVPLPELVLYTDECKPTTDPDQLCM